MNAACQRTVRRLLVLLSLVVLANQVLGATPGQSEGTMTGRHHRSGDTLYFQWTCLTPWRGEVELGFSVVMPDWDGMQATYRSHNHTETSKWEKRFIYNDPFVSYLPGLTNYLNQLAAKNQLIVADVALSFVQSLPHSEWTGQRYAIETLIDQAGDCSDKSMLLAGLFYALGIDYVILDFPGHQALGVWDLAPGGVHYWSQGRAYSFCETNAGLRPVGWCPPPQVGAPAQVRHPA